MRKVFLSVLLHVFGTPVLGRPLPSPLSLGSGGSVKGNTYAPQLKLACTLYLGEAATVQGARIFLDELVRCDGPQTLCREVSAIDFGASPKPGQEITIKSSDLQAIVAAEYPQHSFTFAGAPLIKVRASSKPIDQASVRATIEERLSAEEGKNKLGLRFRLQSLRVPQMFRLRHNSYALEFPDWQEQMERLQLAPRRTLITLQVRAIDSSGAGEEAFEWQAQIGVRAEIKALLANRALVRGSMPSESDVIEQWLPYQENVLRSKAELGGKSLRMSVKAGQVLRVYELVQEPDVRRGDRIEAAVLTSGVKMSASGQALDTGAIGQKIRIQLDSTKRQVMGLVIAKAQVEVHLP